MQIIQSEAENNFKPQRDLAAKVKLLFGGRIPVFSGFYSSTSEFLALKTFSRQVLQIEMRKSEKSITFFFLR